MAKLPLKSRYFHLPTKIRCFHQSVGCTRLQKQAKKQQQKQQQRRKNTGIIIIKDYSEVPCVKDVPFIGTVTPILKWTIRF